MIEKIKELEQRINIQEEMLNQMANVLQEALRNMKADYATHIDELVKQLDERYNIDEQV